MMNKLNCAEAKQISLVSLLAALGYQPNRIRNHDFWYLSPLKDEETPSFKVDDHANIWYDHGTGQGSNLVDFGLLYFQCSVAELLHRLSGMSAGNSLSFHRHWVREQGQYAAISAGENRRLQEPGRKRLMNLW